MNSCFQVKRVSRELAKSGYLATNQLIKRRNITGFAAATFMVSNKHDKPQQTRGSAGGESSSLHRSLSGMSSTLSSIKSIKSTSSLKSLKSSGSGGGNYGTTTSSSNSGNKMMKIIPIRALSDNYMYLLIDEQSKQAACIDPVNASAMSSAVYDHNADLKLLLTTHHHHDHAGGNRDMVKMYPEIIVYGGDSRIPELERKVAHGDTIKLGSLTIECLSTPCHTKGHICYYVTAGGSSDDQQQEQSPGASASGTSAAAAAAAAAGTAAAERAVFTGDTLFIAGCGRFFEGSSEQMDHNLNQILASLPNDTKVYCGHEYTVTNLKFALSVEPSNMDIKGKLQWAQNKVAKKEPTVPSSIGEEKKINPFMRIRTSAAVKKYTGETDELEVMSVLRQRKNDFAS